MITPEIKRMAVELRHKGLLYSEINAELGRNVPKSTMYYWFRDLSLSPAAERILDEKIARHLITAQTISANNRITKRDQHFEQLQYENLYLSDMLGSDPNVAKIALIVLFMAEGSKHTGGSVVFCNSDPYIVRLFLHLLRTCYKLTEEKFRCTVQCRADQNVVELQTYWENITKIPLKQFLKAQVDKRSIGKPTKKEGYRGVCKVDYYSASIFHELIQVSRIIYQGP